MRIRWRDFEIPNSVVCEESTRTPQYGRLIVEPFERGFGVTVGGKTFSGSYHGENSQSREDRLQTRMLDAEGTPLKGRYLLNPADPDFPKRVAGYYEAEVPQSVLKTGTRKVDVSWVDFYRR